MFIRMIYLHRCGGCCLTCGSSGASGAKTGGRILSAAEIYVFSEEIMLVSTKGRYALRIMLELGKYGRDSYIPLPQIAQAQEVSEKYLESIIAMLVRGGLVEGLRGKGGGYRLTRNLEEYSVGEVLRLTEGSLAPVACLEEEQCSCPRAGKCVTLPMWRRLENMIDSYLDSIDLRSLASGEIEGGPEAKKCSGRCR